MLIMKVRTSLREPSQGVPLFLPTWMELNYQTPWTQMLWKRITLEIRVSQSVELMKTVWSLFATHFFFRKTGSSPVRDKTTAHLFNKSVEFHPKSGLSDNWGSSLFSEGRWMKTHTKAPRIGKLGQLTSSHLKGRSVMPMKTSPIMQLSAYGIRYPSLIAELSGEKSLASGSCTWAWT